MLELIVALSEKVACITAQKHLGSVKGERLWSEEGSFFTTA